MKKVEKLKKWLADRQRSYADGIAFFNELARPVQKEKYASYFAAVTNPGQFDPHFTMLIGVLSRIERDARIQPKLYPAAMQEVPVSKTPTEDQTKVEKEKREAAIIEHEEQLKELNERLDELNEDSENNADEISELQNRISAHEDSLKQLRQEVDDLSKPGVKVVTEASMPTDIKKAYDRIKEITPLYASLHNDIANESTTEEKRKQLAEQLCDLDDERRTLWKQIDNWAEGKNAGLAVEAERPQYSDNPVVRGYEMARTIKRLKQNIANSQKAADKAKEDGRQVVYDNAMKRIANYKIELEEIEREMQGESAE